jgi:hypothetical protein
VEAVRRVVDSPFTDQGLRRISAECDARNLRSAWLMPAATHRPHLSAAIGVTRAVAEGGTLAAFAGTPCPCVTPVNEERLIGMALGRQRKTPEELEDERREAEAGKQADQLEKERQAFYRSPAGQARAAFERGDHVFQYSIDVMSQQAVIVAMVGSGTSKTTTDPVGVLNSVCHEGWELVNGSFVFVEQGQQSRDKFMSSGQNVAIKGTTVGYYLLRRCEANARRGPAP